MFQSKWISLANYPEESAYWKKLVASEQKRSKVKDILCNPWPLSVTLPDMVYTFTYVKSNAASYCYYLHLHVGGRS